MTRPQARITRLSIGMMVAVYGEEVPSDEEWERYIAFISEIRPQESLLIFSWGPGPNMRQRRLLEEAVGHHQGKVAVVTGSRVARGVVKAISWTGRNIRAFDFESLPKAFEYLELKNNQHHQALRYAILLAEELSLRRQAVWLSQFAEQQRSAESSARMTKVS